MCAWGGKSRSHLPNDKIPGVVCKIKSSMVGDNLDCWITEGWGGGCTRLVLTWFEPGFICLCSRQAGKASTFQWVYTKTLQTDFKIGTTQAKFCPLYQESSGFPLFILQHLGSAAFTQMLQIPLSDALAGKAAGHQGSCWCRTALSSSLSPWKSCKIPLFLGAEYFRHKTNPG